MLSLEKSNAAWTEVNPHLLLFVFLPILIFESALHCEWHIFKRQLKSILALAIPGVIISTALSACILKMLHSEDEHWDWTAALTCGAILAATDPVAVVALMKELGVSERLGTLMEGESLLNDGTAIVVFGVFYARMLETYQVCHAKALDGSEMVVLFFRLGLGGVVLGGLMGWLLQKSLSRVFNDPPTEVTLTVLAAFGVMLLAEGTVIEVSGVLAVVTLGLTMAAKGKFFISSCSVDIVDAFWSTLGHLANTVIFFVAGLIVAARAASDPHLLANSLWRAIAIWVLLHLVRAIMLFMLWPVLSSGSYSFSINQACAVVYGGLRGAVGLTLALIVSEQLDEQRILLEVTHPNKSKNAGRLGDEILFYVAIVAFLTLLVNGTTMEFVLLRLGLSSTEEASERSLEQAIAILSKETVMTLAKIKQHEVNDSDTDWAAALAYVPARSQDSYQILRAAMEDELNSADIGLENLRKSLSMRELQHESVLTNAISTVKLWTDKVKNFFGIEDEEKADVSPLLARIPNRLKDRWMKYEQKWDDFDNLDDEYTSGDGVELAGSKKESEYEARMPSSPTDPSQTDSQAASEKQDMYELRRRFCISLKLAFHKLQLKGICEGESTAALVDCGNRQLDDTDESKEHRGAHMRGTSPSYLTAIMHDGLKVDETLYGRPMLSWYHLMDAVDVSMPDFLSNEVFACLMNTKGCRLFLKEVVAGRLGSLFEIVDGFIVGHAMALKQFTRREHQVGEENAKVLKLERLLHIEVSAQQQLAKNMMDALLVRFPEIARSIKTKKAARRLLSADRLMIEKLSHEGRIEEGEEEELLEKNNISLKKLHDHPAGLTVPSKVDRISRHELFVRVLDPSAAKALAAISTERYFDPNCTLVSQGAPANKWFLPIHGEYCYVRETGQEGNIGMSHCGCQMKSTEEDITSHWHKHDGMFLYTGDDKEHAHRLAAIIHSMRHPMGLGNAPLCLGDAISYALASEAANAENVGRTSGSSPTVAPAKQSAKTSKRGSILFSGASSGTKLTGGNYSSSLRSPGHTQVLQIDSVGTWNLMKEHKSLRTALWRFVSASLVATNSVWIQQFIPASIPVHHTQHMGDEHIPSHDAVGKALALAILPQQLRQQTSPIGKIISLGSVIAAGGDTGDTDLLDGKIPESIVAVLLLHGHVSLGYGDSPPKYIQAPNFSVPATDDDHNCFISVGEMNDSVKPSCLKAGPGTVLLLLSADEIHKVHSFAKRITKNASLKVVPADPVSFIESNDPVPKRSSFSAGRASNSFKRSKSYRK